MPASTSLQSRIQVFESQGMPTTPTRKPPPNPLEEPISPTANLRLYSPMQPSSADKPSVSRSPSPEPPGLGAKTSLIDLKDWVVDDGPLQTLPPIPPRPQSAKPPSSTGAMTRPPTTPRIPSASSTPLITLNQAPSPQKTARAPPLPPRKPSLSSIHSTFSDSSSSIRQASGSPATLRASDSLSPNDTHTYPPVDRPRGGHAQASSISSFHSVSLSSDGGGEPGSPHTAIGHSPELRDADAESVDSFDHVSATSVLSSYEWPRSLARNAPALPARSNVASPRLPSSPTLSGGGRTPTMPALPYVPRRIPPPPPPISGARSPPPSSRASVASVSDRSSILSTGTASTSRTSVSAQSTAAPPKMPPKSEVRQLTRPTPVPVPARARYDSVFVANVLARKAKGDGQKQSRKGWRGLSVDLITMESTGEVEEVGADATLDAVVVATLWSASKLPRDKLKAIWDECDPSCRGCLDRDAFAKGMWRIDEELRRVQFALQTALANAPSGPYAVRKPRQNTALMR